jgi:metal-responsive CopG/Arc/MetJ family transcriptional regulator
VKTAISIPDGVFEAAERLARQLGLSRSQLYRNALLELLQRYRDGRITERLNEVYGREDSGLDSVSYQLQRKSLPRDEW